MYKIFHCIPSSYVSRFNILHSQLLHIHTHTHTLEILATVICCQFFECRIPFPEYIIIFSLPFCLSNAPWSLSQAFIHAFSLSGTSNPWVFYHLLSLQVSVFVTLLLMAFPNLLKFVKRSWLVMHNPLYFCYHWTYSPPLVWELQKTWFVSLLFNLYPKLYMS